MLGQNDFSIIVIGATKSCIVIRLRVPNISDPYSNRSSYTRQVCVLRRTGSKTSELDGSSHDSQISITLVQRHMFVMMFRQRFVCHSAVTHRLQLQHIVTSGKEGMLYPAFVCLSVGTITLKLVDEFWWNCWRDATCDQHKRSLRGGGAWGGA